MSAAAASSSKSKRSVHQSKRKLPRNGENLSSNQLLIDLKNKSGVYFISQDPVPQNDEDMMLVKIGIGLNQKFGSDISNRIQSYLLYWPRGFNIFGIILTHRDAARDLEKTIHALLLDKGRKMDPTEYKHSHIEEWFYLTRREIYQLISHDPNGDFYLFDPAHNLVENPTAGKQRKVKSMTAQQKSAFFPKNSKFTPIRTADTPMRKNAKSRIEIVYHRRSPRRPRSPQAAAAAADNDNERDDADADDDEDIRYKTPRNVTTRQQKSQEKRVFAKFLQQRGAAAADEDSEFKYVDPIMDDDIDSLPKPSEADVEIFAPKKRKKTPQTRPGGGGGGGNSSSALSPVNHTRAITRSQALSFRRLSGDFAADPPNTPYRGPLRRSTRRRK